jgi:hypothetical protein
VIENQNPIAEEWADEYHVSADMVPAKSMGEAEDEPPPAPPAPPPPVEPDDEEVDDESRAREFRRLSAGHAPSFEDAASRLLTRRRATVARAVKRHDGNPAAFDRWAREFRASQLDDAYRSFNSCRLSVVATATALGINGAAGSVAALNAWANHFASSASLLESEPSQAGALAAIVRESIVSAVIAAMGVQDDA